MILAILLIALSWELVNFVSMLLDVTKEYWYRGKIKEFGDMWVAKRRVRDEKNVDGSLSSGIGGGVDLSMNESAMELN